MLNLQQSKIEKEKIIAQSRNCKIYQYSKDDAETEYVIKYLDIDNQADFLSIMKSIVIGFSCDNPNIVQISGYDVVPIDQSSYDVFLKLPKMNGNLHSFIESYKTQEFNNKIPETKIICYFISLVCGLQYLHEKGFVHGNLKPSNILISPEGEMKLADFCIYRSQIEKANENSKINIWRAPEFTQQEKEYLQEDLFAADIWSLGVIIVCLCLLDANFPTQFESHSDFIQQALEQLSKNYSSTLFSIIEDMICINPKDRKTIQKIHQKLLHPFGSRMKHDQNKSNQRKLSQEEEKNGNEHESFHFEQNPEEKWEDWSSAVKEIQKKWGKFFRIKAERISHLDVAKTWGEATGALIKMFIEDVCTVLKEFGIQKITEFHFSIANSTSINDEGIKQISDAIAEHFRIVKVLDLTFNQSCDITDEAIKYLLNGIGQNVGCLEHLGLGFSGSHGRFYGYNYLKFTNQTFEYFVSELKKKHFSALKHLKLGLRACDKITDEGLHRLASTVGSNLTSLESFDLDLSRCIGITGIGICQLISKVSQNLQGLEHLGLSLNWCANLSNNDVNLFTLSLIQNLKRLKSLTLELDHCSDISDETVAFLSQNLPKIQTLNQLCLSFMDCKKISNKALNYLGVDLRPNLKDLQRASFSFYECGKVTNDAKLGLKKAFGPDCHVEIK